MSEIAADRPQSRLPVAIALLLIGSVWVGSCVISFMEQIRLADLFGFREAWLFPLIFDGLASALAVTSWSAALDGRHSPLLRLVTMSAVSGSAWVNAAAVIERTSGPLDVTQVGMAVAAPISAWIAFEFLLSELRRQIMRARGVPAPASVPALRPVRVALAPVRAVREWRTLTLDVTAPRHTIAPRAADSGTPAAAAPSEPAAPAAAPAVPAALPAAVPAARGTGGESGTQDGAHSGTRALDNGTDPRTPAAPDAEVSADESWVSGTLAVDHGERSGTLRNGNGTGNRPAAESGTNGEPAAAVPPPAAAPAAPAAAVTDPAALLAALGVTVPPPADARQMPAAELRAAARHAWRTATAHGHQITGAGLGGLYGRSARWGREQISAVRQEDRSVIRLAESR